MILYLPNEDAEVLLLALQFYIESAGADVPASVVRKCSDLYTKVSACRPPVYCHDVTTHSTEGGKMSLRWKCYLCGHVNASTRAACMQCKLKRVDTSGVPANVVAEKHKLSAAQIALALLYDEEKHPGSGYDSQLGLYLARAVLLLQRGRTK